MKNTKLVAGLATLLVAFIAVAVTPTASAQAGQASIKIDSQKLDDTQLKNGRLPPEIAQVTIDFTFSVTMPPVTGVCPAGTVTVEFTNPKKGGDWATVTVSPSAVTQPVLANNQQQQTIGGFSTKMTIVTTRKAPAFQTGEYVISAVAKPSVSTNGGCNVANSGEFKVSNNIVNDYFPIMEYQPSKYIQKTGQNKDVLFTVKASNFGNGDTKVTAVYSPISKNKLDAVIPPAQTTLESKAAVGEKALFSKDVQVSGRTPHSNGYTNSIYTFSIAFTAGSVQAGSDTKDEQTLTLSVQVQGVYVPGFDPAGAIAALGVAVLLLGFARRRR
jgi:hypothetical protein